MAIGKTSEARCLESALVDANIFGEIVFSWMARGLQLEDSHPPRISQAQAGQAYWAIATLSRLLNEAYELYEEGHR